MKLLSSFIKGRMNKSVDERLLPQGEYVDAMNIRLGSTEESEIGAVENAKGNEVIATLQYQNQDLSPSAICIGSLDDTENDTIYWCVHDPANAQSPTTSKVDMIASYDVTNDVLIYHVVSTDDGGGVNTALNFSSTYRVNAMTFIDGLLFFTDNNNQPMRINTNSVYNEPSVADLLVIVKPPSESPDVELFQIPGDENYMDTRFISFAYRYKYVDGEYSPLSQFSQIAFDPKEFSLSIDTYQNEGMVNEFNAAQVSFNTGGGKVSGIDVVFKLSNQSVISVIEKFNKEEQGWGDNQTQDILFDNRKIYTTLGSGEILRTFDNVPRKAQAQTLMGNRLMYGNYVDGYDVVDSDGEKCEMTYLAELKSQSFDADELAITYAAQTYTIDPLSSPSITASKIEIDCSSIASNLVEGGEFSMGFTVSHDSFSGAGAPTTTQADYNVNFRVILQQGYNSVANFIQSTEFKNALEGVTIPTNLTQCGTINQGVSATDQYNCTIQPPSNPVPLINWNVDGSGVVGVGTPLTATVVGDTVTITLVAMRFVDAAAPGVYLYEYFGALNASASYSEIGTRQSLHSDRDYEVGIVYMDNYNRSTTALVSKDNTLFVPPGASTSKNSIKVTIPPTQKPPSWATRYKFVVKPSSIDYEVIYSDLFFIDQAQGATFIKLEGDNQTKAAKGDRLRVKRDTSGPLIQRIETVILELEAKGKDFIDGNTDDNGSDIIEPAGLYMKVKPSGFNTNYTDDTFLGGVTQVFETDTAPFQTNSTQANGLYECFVENPTFDPAAAVTVGNTRYKPWTLPVNSRVVFDIKFSRERRGNLCEAIEYVFYKEVVATQNYNSLYYFVNGENIDFTSGEFIEGTGTINFYPALRPWNAATSYYPPTPPSLNFGFVGGDQSGQFNPDPDPAGATTQAGKQFLQLITPFNSCTGISPRQAVISANIRAYTSENVLIFETLPVESDANIYYESSDSYAITNGNHMSGSGSGDVNQVIDVNPALSVSGVVNLSFFNCFAFGNGAESYKIRDGLASPSFRLGERTTAVSEQDFKEAHRFADITYSGIYNEDTNVNRLNEFNLGLANFKELEKSFGPIRVLSARETDILTLQEDKVSYVLSSKNLLSDSSGGGAIASIPEVLGTQIARIENFGISNNPESFVQWGYDKYFTDVKRGAVLKLSGLGQQETLTVISESGMRSWFRDFFILTPNTQKLGGYDPYMNEYVLSGNLTSLPTSAVKVQCGTDYNVLKSLDPTTTWTAILGLPTGQSTVSWTALLRDPGATITVNVTYNGVVYTSGATSATSGTFTFNKNLSGVTEATVSVVVSSGIADFSVKVGCPVETALDVIKICINANNEAGKYIHNDYYWTQGTFTSPTSSDLVFLVAQDNSPTASYSISQYSRNSGVAGRGLTPAIPGATPVTIRIQSTKKGFDDFTFDPASDTLKYLVSSTLYNNTPADINTLLPLATTATPLVNPLTGVYYFDIPYTTPNDYLYLIYDYS